MATTPRARAAAAANAPAAGAAAPAAAPAPALTFTKVVLALPPRSGGGGAAGQKYPFDSLQLGEAFFVPYGSATSKQVMNRMTGAVTRAKKNFEANYSARHFTDVDNVFGYGVGTQGVGIWRVPMKEAAPATTVG
jgi:hypothetical protein